MPFGLGGKTDDVASSLALVLHFPDGRSKFSRHKSSRHLVIRTQKPAVPVPTCEARRLTQFCSSFQGLVLGIPNDCGNPSQALVGQHPRVTSPLTLNESDIHLEHLSQAFSKLF